MRSMLRAVLIVSCLVILTPALRAQPGDPGARTDALGRFVFPAELVMEHQSEIALTREQRDAVVREVQSLQSDVVPLQFEMGEAAEQLKALLDAPRVDEKQAIEAARRVTALESRVKQRHLTLLIRIKNLLSPEQQTLLRQLRRPHSRARDHRPER